jgi:nicotinamide-nucleotide amidase
MMQLPVLAQRLAAALGTRGLMLATAESCTGGLIAQTLTDLPGSSAWYERGFVTYSNAAKTELLGVDAALIAVHGAVSEACAQAMAEGALVHSHAQLALAVTGIAGPGGGSAEKPVGLVYLAWAMSGQPGRVRHCQFQGDRTAIRARAAAEALAGALEMLDG